MKMSKNRHGVEKDQCCDIGFPMSRHCVEKVLTLLQCCDIVATLTEERKEMICQCHDIITKLSRHQVNVATVQAMSRHCHDMPMTLATMRRIEMFNVTTSQLNVTTSTRIIKYYYQLTNVATSP